MALEGQYVVPAAERSPSGRVEASLVAAGVRPCVFLGDDGRRERVRFEACARGLFGGLFAEASGVGISTPSTDPYVAAGAELAVDLPVGPRFGVRCHGGGVATITRTFLRIKDAGRDVDVWHSPALSGSLGLDAVGRFP
jgi:hypothetical protein